MKLKTTAAIGSVAVLVAAFGMFGGNGGFSTSTDTGDRRTMVRAEVEASGPFHVTLNSDSSVHGHREHANGSYTRSFAEDIQVRSGEVIAVFLTSALDIDRNSRQRNEVRIKVNGKTVCSQAITTRAGDVPTVAECSWRQAN